MERELASIYVKTFFATAGRPPCIPHIAPEVSIYGPPLDDHALGVVRDEQIASGDEDESWYYD